MDTTVSSSTTDAARYERHKAAHLIATRPQPERTDAEKAGAVFTGSHGVTGPGLVGITLFTDRDAPLMMREAVAEGSHGGSKFDLDRAGLTYVVSLTAEDGTKVTAHVNVKDLVEQAVTMAHQAATTKA